jgi:hypothetical protein
MKNTTIKNIYQLRDLLLSFEGDENDFNILLLQMMEKGQLKKGVFLEYLEITQGDIMESLEELEEEDED